jgi:hypothetical protein
LSTTNNRVAPVVYAEVAEPIIVAALAVVSAPAMLVVIPPGPRL